ETMPEVQSAAYSLLVPAGSALDPAGQNGAASVLSDWLARGAGDRDNREFSCELDRWGIQHGQSVTASHQSFSGSCLAENLSHALGLLGDMVERPHLPDEEFEACVAGAQHELQALEDEPRQKVMLELVRRCYRAPWGQPPEGTLADLEHLTPPGLRQHFERAIRPDRAILVLAGRVTVAEILPAVRAAFDGWKRGSAATPVLGSRGALLDHLAAESTQTHIGVAYPTVPYRDPDYFAAWAAVSVLSGGMSSRLFTEIREKRGLCYSVYATLSTLKDEGSVLCYAGSTNDRAQETLDVLVQELRRLGEGIAEEELHRAKALAKTSLVMQQESSSARAGSLARDWYHLGRITTPEEVQQKIERLTTASVVEFVRKHPPEPCTVVTIGPAALETSAS
ncbi:MAG TPA: pitrilysin family protein, partial [Planctomycetaceae bacterium]|nr:pitrilysin family protein [Planctomycetaceae bacterium]